MTLSPSVELGGDAVEEADVLVVEVDVDEAAQLAAVHDAVAQAGVPGVEVGEELVEGARRCPPRPSAPSV